MPSKGTTGNPVAQANYGQPPAGGAVTTYAWGDSSGPWYIENQRMDIQYVRVPNYNLASETLGLSSVATTHNVMDTHLLCGVNAYVSMVSSTDNYTTSSDSQNQRFLVNNVSADPYGNTYGELDSSSLGPQGQIYTASSYVYRVLLDQYLQNVTVLPQWLGASSVRGVNFVLAGGDNSMLMVDASADQQAEMWDFKRSQKANAPGSFLPGPVTNTNGENSPQPAQLLETLNVLDRPVYTMGGTYNPAFETYFSITQAIDLLGSEVQTKFLAGTPPFTGPGFGFAGANYMGFNQGLDNYDITRHDFS